MGNLRDIIRELIKDNEEIYSTVCTVSEVDETLRTCDVKPINGDADIFNVRLQSKNETEIGLVLFPTVGSDVTVTFISKELAFVSCTNEIDKIQLNIGEFSLFMDGENFEKSVENIKINTTSYEKTATDTKINSENYELTGENATFTLSDIFKVESAKDIELNALKVAIAATDVNITGKTTVTGATTINGVTTINGAASISGAATMASSLVIAGGTNGGMPIGSKIKDELNKVIAELNKIKSAFNGWTPVNNDGGAALKARASTFQSGSLPLVATSGISNDNVKH